MAVIIYPNGSDAPMAPPANGKSYTLAEMYAAIGCDMVQSVRITNDDVLLMDEEAKLPRNGQPRPSVNVRATGMASGVLRFGDKIIGTVVHVRLTESGDWVPLTKEGTSE
jgi:hypothetical protein